MKPTEIRWDNVFALTKENSTYHQILIKHYGQEYADLRWETRGVNINYLEEPECNYLNRRLNTFLKSRNAYWKGYG